MNILLLRTKTVTVAATIKIVETLTTRSKGEDAVVCDVVGRCDGGGGDE